ncbi:MAG: TetR/AcrR family transcriptional regulator [Solirubrobacteraceae bacterium]
MGGGRGARERILAAARELFARQGIGATGVAQLCAEAHVSKRTLYQHFAGKDELVVAWLDAFATDGERGPEAVLARADLTPRTRLLELYATLNDGPRPLRGDPLVNAAAEVGDTGAPAHRVAAEHKRAFERRLVDLSRAAGARDPELIGRRLALLYDGAAAEAVLHDSPQPAADAQAMAAAILRDAID